MELVVNKHLMWYNNWQFGGDIFEKRRLLSENKKLKERVDDADKAIEEVKNCIEKNKGKSNGFAVVVSGILITDYLKKWGVKWVTLYVQNVEWPI